MTPSGIEPATFRLVAQCLKPLPQYHTSISLYTTCFDITRSSLGSFTFVPCQGTNILKIKAVNHSSIKLLKEIVLCEYDHYWLEPGTSHGKTHICKTMVMEVNAIKSEGKWGVDMNSKVKWNGERLLGQRRGTLFWKYI